VAHAGPAALDRLEPLLAAIRKLGLVEERKRGIFYRRRVAFLHFHEEGKRIHADLKRGGDFTRYPANGKRDWARLLAAVKRAAADRGARDRAAATRPGRLSDASCSSARRRGSRRPCP
jgi:hypothetical protein